MRIWARHLRGTAIPVLSVFLIFASSVCCFAATKEMTESLPDDYLGSEFSWSMVLDLPDVDYYLKYRGSKLWPLTKITVNLKCYPQRNKCITATSTFYEEFWYRNEIPVGLRRYNQISIPPQSDGAIIVCPGDSESDLSSRAPAIADALVRLLVDVQFRNAVIGIVMVPGSEYDAIASTLSRYKFFKNSPIRPISIHLRAYPNGKDDMFYLQNHL